MLFGIILYFDLYYLSQWTRTFFKKKEWLLEVVWKGNCRASKFQKSHSDSDFSSGELFAWYSVSQVPQHVWSRRENFGVRGSQMIGKSNSQPCSMDISVCQSTPFSVLCTTKYPFTYLLKKKLTPLLVQLPVQISVTSSGTVLNFRFYRSFLFRMAIQGVMGHLIKT